MKIIYRVKIAEHGDQYTSFLLFDTYDAIEDWLEKYLGKIKKVTRLGIDTLIMCDDCHEYDDPSTYSFIYRGLGESKVYCIGCAPDHKIYKWDYIKKENNDEN